METGKGVAPKLVIFTRATTAFRIFLLADDKRYPTPSFLSPLCLRLDSIARGLEQMAGGELRPQWD